MKQIVDELMAAVEGAGTAAAPKTPPIETPRRAFAKAVDTLKSKVGASRQPKKPMTEAVIPFEEDKTFADF